MCLLFLLPCSCNFTQELCAAKLDHISRLQHESGAWANWSVASTCPCPGRMSGKIRGLADHNHVQTDRPSHIFSCQHGGAKMTPFEWQRFPFVSPVCFTRGEPLIHIQCQVVFVLIIITGIDNKSPIDVSCSSQQGYSTAPPFQGIPGGRVF